VDLTEQHQQLMDLAARVPEADISAARRMLQALIVDPLWLSLEAAPLDDEEYTPEDAAILEAEASIARGEGIPHEEIMREFGLRAITDRSIACGYPQRGPLCSSNGPAVFPATMRPPTT
jgi:hypothetical protein